MVDMPRRAALPPTAPPRFAARRAGTLIAVWAVYALGTLAYLGYQSARAGFLCGG
ncbi:MAG: hypothetical protein OHK0048_18170 [Rhodoferax sp.]